MVGRTLVIVVALFLIVVFLFLAAYVCTTPSDWTTQTRALVAAACCAVAAAVLHISYRFLQPGPPQSMSPFLLLALSAGLVLAGLAVVVPGVRERDVDVACGGLIFLAFGVGGTAQAVRRLAGSRGAAETDREVPEAANAALTPTARDLDAAQRTRRVAVLLAWCIWAISASVALFTSLPRTVAVLTFFASLVPYVVSIRFIEPRLLRRGSR